MACGQSMAAKFDDLPETTKVSYCKGSSTKPTRAYVVFNRSIDPTYAQNVCHNPLFLSLPFITPCILSCLLIWILVQLSSDIAASEHIADLLLSGETRWPQKLKDPRTSLLSTDQHCDGGSHDVNTPVKKL